MNILRTTTTNPHKMSDCTILAGNGCLELANRIGKMLEISVNHNASIGRFNNSETNVVVGSVRDKKTVYIIQSFGAEHDGISVDQQFMELILMANAARVNGANNIVAIIPCYGYARQDRTKIGERKPLSASVIASTLQLDNLGIDSFYVIDIHCEQVQNAFQKSLFQNLGVAPVFAKHIAECILPDEEICIVAPDHGAVARNKNFQRHLEHFIGRSCSFAIIDKERVDAGVIKEMILTTTEGSIEGKTCIIVDDMGDTCGTMCKAAAILKSRKANKIWAAITHPVLSGNAQQKIEHSHFEQVFVSDSIPFTKGCSKLRTISLDYLLSTVINNLENMKKPVLSDIYHIGALTNSEPTESQKNFQMFYHQRVSICNKLYGENLKIGILSNNPTKLACVEKKFPNSTIRSMMDPKYIPRTEQPIGLKETRECLVHRYRSSDVYKRWGLDFIVGVESGICLMNDKVHEITQSVIIDPKTDRFYYLEEDYQTSSLGPEYFNDYLKCRQEMPDQARTFSLWLTEMDFHEDAMKCRRTALIDYSLNSNFIGDVDLEDLISLRKFTDLIEYHENFPEPGVTFQNLYPLFRDTDAFKAIIDKIVSICKFNGTDTICAVGSRGYLLGAPVAYQLGIQLIPITKPGKLPSDKVDIVSYKKEYGTDSLQIEKGLICGDDKVMIIDDVLATGGSMAAAGKLVSADIPHEIIGLVLTHVEELAPKASFTINENIDEMIVLF